MDRQQISRIAHAGHPIASPLDDVSVRHLLDQGLPRGDERVLDLGCDGGEWLSRALAHHPRLWAAGVDTSAESLAHARTTVVGRGVADRLVLHHEDAADFRSPHPFGLVLSAGAAHAGRGPAASGPRRAGPGG